MQYRYRLSEQARDFLRAAREGRTDEDALTHLYEQFDNLPDSADDATAEALEAAASWLYSEIDRREENRIEMAKWRAFWAEDYEECEDYTDPIDRGW